MTTATIIATLLSVVGVLVALTNVIVQVLKQITWAKIPTNMLAVVVSLVITMLAFFVWISYTGTAFVWYMAVGAVILAFLVAYAAMFGYDKLKEIITNLQL